METDRIMEEFYYGILVVQSVGFHLTNSFVFELQQNDSKFFFFW